jgi:hypothetical protein
MMFYKIKAVVFYVGFVREMLLKVQRVPQNWLPSLQSFNLTWKAEKSVESLLASKE